eukprot:2591995-Rhodomonas_salina.4
MWFLSTGRRIGQYRVWHRTIGERYQRARACVGSLRPRPGSGIHQVSTGHRVGRVRRYWYRLSAMLCPVLARAIAYAMSGTGIGATCVSSTSERRRAHLQYQHTRAQYRAVRRGG